MSRARGRHARIGNRSTSRKCVRTGGWTPQKSWPKADGPKGPAGGPKGWPAAQKGFRTAHNGWPGSFNVFYTGAPARLLTCFLGVTRCIWCCQAHVHGTPGLWVALCVFVFVWKRRAIACCGHWLMPTGCARQPVQPQRGVTVPAVGPLWQSTLPPLAPPLPSPRRRRRRRRAVVAVISHRPQRRRSCRCHHNRWAIVVGGGGTPTQHTDPAH